MENTSIDISVIMPAYKAEAYIAQALDSVIAQQFNGTFDIWVADDISPDDTGRIIDEYQQRYPQLIHAVARTQNLGCSSNSLDLVLRSTGKYVAYCDNDDYWIDPLKLQKQFDFLETNPEYGLTCCGAKIVDENGNGSKLSDTPFVESFMEMMQLPRDAFNSSVMLRKELYLQMVEDSKWFIDNKCFFDTVWAYWFAYHSKIHYMPEHMLAYRELAESESHSEDKERLYRMDKRYWTLKARFLLTHDMNVEDKMTILSHEYDYLYETAYYQGMEQVKKSKPYRFGRAVKKWLLMKK